MKRFLFSLVALAFISGARCEAQTAADVNEGTRMTQNATTGVYTLSWWGRSGRTYFIQQSEDMVHWSYLPLIESGGAAATEYGFTSTAPHFFLRLRHTNAATGGNPDAADFDGDGLSNAEEVGAAGPHTDPFIADMDGDGFNDGAEVRAGTDPKSMLATPLLLGESLLAQLIAQRAAYETALQSGTYDQQVTTYVNMTKKQGQLQNVVNTVVTFMPGTQLMLPVSQPLGNMPDSPQPAGDPGKAWFKVWQIDGMAGIASNWSDNTRAEVLVGGALADFNSWDDIRSPRDWELLRHDFQDLAGPWVRNRMAWLVPQIDRNGGGTSRIEWGGAEPMVAPAGAIRLNPGGEAPPQGVGDGGPWLYLEWHDLSTIEVEHPAPYDRKFLCLVRRHKQYHQEPDEVVGTVTFKVAAGETEPTTEFDGLAPNDLCRATADGLLEMGPTYGPVFPWGIYPIHLGGDPANDPDPAYPAFDECDVVPVPVDLFLDNNNIAYKLGSEALGVSNYVTTDGLPADSQFADVCDDPENFRLQAKLPNSTATSVQMTLEVKRDGAVISTHDYTLDKKAGDLLRGNFLRLVTDTNDDAESGDQTILVKLGDKIKASYDITAGSKIEQEIQVGRPSSEDNNDADPWKHDIREVKCRFVVFGNAATAAQIDQEIDTLNERYAQCGVKMKVIEKKLGEALPAEFANGGFTRGSSPIQIANADERELLNHLDADNNTVDFMYVPDLNDGLGNAVRATAYRAGRNATGNAAFQNFVVVGPTRSELSVGHELMHVLLNISHRMSTGGAWLDATTALFHGTTTKAVDGTKRIGPYPAAASGVGNDDTTTIRNNAEQLP